jgi:hypothetical protein
MRIEKLKAERQAGRPDGWQTSMDSFDLFMFQFE